MFTGIVEEIGTIESIQHLKDSARISIRASRIMSDMHVGDSIAVNGICLTVTSFSDNVFYVDAMHETLRRSSLSEMRNGTHVNLERAMASNGRFGGHIVSGHIDGTGRIRNIHKDGIAVWYEISADPSIIHYIVKKGSVAVDGISLTVAAVGADFFSVSTIPHTNAFTTLNERKTGDTVNLENDIVGKYIEHFLTDRKDENKQGITEEFLAKCGF